MLEKFTTDKYLAVYIYIYIYIYVHAGSVQKRMEGLVHDVCSCCPIVTELDDQ